MEPESNLGVMVWVSMLLEPESMLSEPESMLLEPESMLSCENRVSSSPWTLDFGLGLDKRTQKICCLLTWPDICNDCYSLHK